MASRTSGHVRLRYTWTGHLLQIRQKPYWPKNVEHRSVIIYTLVLPLLLRALRPKFEKFLKARMHDDIPSAARTYFHVAIRLSRLSLSTSSKPSQLATTRSPFREAVVQKQVHLFRGWKSGL